MKGSEIVKTPAFQYGVMAIILLVVIYFLFDKLEDAFKSLFGTDDPDNEENTTITETNQLEVVQTNLTHDPAQYDIWADLIYDAVNTAGTSWDNIYEIMRQQRTDDDVKQLINVYGIRTVYFFAVPTAPANLPMILQRESQWDWQGVEHVNEIFEENGITIRF